MKRFNKSTQSKKKKKKKNSFRPSQLKKHKIPRVQVKIEEETKHFKGERESVFLQVHFGFIDGQPC
jgi:hypothetical protein